MRFKIILPAINIPKQDNRKRSRGLSMFAVRCLQCLQQQLFRTISGMPRSWRQRLTMRRRPHKQDHRSASKNSHHHGPRQKTGHLCRRLCYRQYVVQHSRRLTGDAVFVQWRTCTKENETQSLKEASSLMYLSVLLPCLLRLLCRPVQSPVRLLCFLSNKQCDVDNSIVHTLWKKSSTS